MSISVCEAGETPEANACTYQTDLPPVAVQVVGGDVFGTIPPTPFVVVALAVFGLIRITGLLSAMVGIFGQRRF